MKKVAKNKELDKWYRDNAKETIEADEKKRKEISEKLEEFYKKIKHLNPELVAF